jgi:hypothetical protein
MHKQQLHPHPAALTAHKARKRTLSHVLRRQQKRPTRTRKEESCKYHVSCLNLASLPASASMHPLLLRGVPLLVTGQTLPLWMLDSISSSPAWKLTPHQTVD